MIFPFVAAPDVFELTISTNLKNIKLEYFESVWGVTDELLCFYGNVLLGQVFTNFKVSDGKAIMLRLLPNLKPERNYPWANRQEFSEGLIQLLSKTIPWILHCEYDADQRPVQQIENNLSMTILELEKTLEYCAGESFDCPSFKATQQIT